MKAERESSRLGLDAAVIRLRLHVDDPAAWQILYSRLWPVAFSISFRMLSGDSDLAEDAAQESFVRLARSIAGSGGDTILASAVTLSAWLRRVAQTSAIDVLRSESRTRIRHVLIDEISEQAEDAAPYVRHVQVIYVGRVLRALAAELPVAERRLLGLVVSEPSTGHIARELGLPYSRTAVKITRLKAKLGKLLQERDLHDFGRGKTAESVGQIADLSVKNHPDNRLYTPEPFAPTSRTTHQL